MPSTWFFTSRFAMSIADQFLLFVVPIMVFQVTQSIAWSSFSFALETIPRVLAYPLAGLISDRYSGIKMVKYSLWFRSIICIIAFGLAWILGEHSLLAIMITLSAMTGVASVQGFISSEVLLPQLFKHRSFAKVQANVQSVDQTAIIGGPLLAATVLQLFNWHFVIVLAGALFLLSHLLFSISVKADNTHLIPSIIPNTDITNTKHPVLPRLNVRSIAQQLYQPFHLIKNSNALLIIIAQTALVNLVFGAALATAAAFVTGTFQLPATAYAFLQMMGAITSVAVLSITAALTERFHLKTLGLFSFFSICVGAMIYALSESYSVFVIGFMIILGFDGMFNVYIRTRRQAIIPVADYGKTTAMIVFFNNLTKPVAGLLIAMFSSSLSAQEVVFALALVSCLCGILLFNVKYD